MRWLVVIGCVIGCGRFQFEALDDAASGDVADDTLADVSSCAATFCDDFDDRADPVGDWDMPLQTGTGTGTVAGGIFTVTLAANSDRYFLVKALPAPTTSVVFSARMSIATTNPGITELDLVPINWDAGTCALPFGFYLVQDATGPFNLQATNGNDGCSGNDNYYVGTRVNTGPFDVRLTITLGTPEGNAQLELDGVDVHNMPTNQPVPSSTLVLKLGGVLVRDYAADWTITYENVIVDVN